MKRVKITEENAYNGSALDRLTGTGTKDAVYSAKPVAPAPPVPSSTIKLSVFLNRQEDAYLENLSSTAKFSGGRKISKTKLVEAMVKAFRASKLDVRGVRTDDELFRRVVAQLNK